MTTLSVLTIVILSVLAATGCAPQPAPVARGPLKVLAGNPRYFTDGSGKRSLEAPFAGDAVLYMAQTN